MATFVNYYAELGLDRGASVGQLESELKALRKKWISRQNAADTDKRQKAERMVELIREATEVLLDADKKKKYDKELDKKGTSATTTTPSESYTPMSTAGLEGAALMDALESYYENSKYNQAIAAANQALASGMANDDVYRYLILSYIEKGDDNGALRAINSMYTALPDDPDCLLLAAKVLLRVMNGHERDARMYLDKLFETGYGDNDDVVALDAEYYIDIGNMTLAEQKINAYLSTNPNDADFKSNIANAYVQYADSHYTVEIGGDWYIDSEDNFKHYEELITKAQKVTPNKKLNELLTVLKKRQIVPGSWVSWGSCFLYAFAGFSAEVPAIGVISLLLGAALLYFSLVPAWMIERYQYHNHLCGLYEVVRYIGIAVSFFWRVAWAIFKFIWNLIWAFV